MRDFAPESQRFYRDKVGAAAYPSRSGYIMTTDDKEFPVALQERFSGRLGSGWKRTLNTGHLPMLQEPEQLGRLIAEFVSPR